MTKKKINFLVTIDTECDKGPGWRVQQPLSFAGVKVGVGEVLEPLFKRHGVLATYLVSPEVMRDSESMRILSEAHEQGAELGTHLHGEFITDDNPERITSTDSRQCDLPPDRERKEISELTNLFKDKFGFSPRSFRAGRFAIGPATLPILADLGYLIDSSVAPSSQLLAREEELLLNGMTRQPYFPSIDNFLVPGDLTILEVPVSAAHIGCRILQKLSISKLFKNSGRIKNIAIKFLGRRHFSLTWLRPTYSSLADMKRLVSRLASRCNKDRLFLVIMFHNVEVVAGASPYNLNEKQVQDFLVRLEGILIYLRSQGGRSITLEQVHGFYRDGNLG